MGAIRKPRFSDGVVEKAMDGFFNNLPGRSRISLTGLANNGHDQPIRFKGALKTLE